MPSSDLRPASTKRLRGGEPRPLSTREREVLGLLAEGMSGAAIAERLVLSPETIRTHVRNAMDKLGASTRSQAVALALERGHIGDARRPEPRGRLRGSDPAIGGALQELVASVTALADIDSAAVYVADESGMVLRLDAHAPDPAGAAPAPEIVLGGTGVGRVALERRTQLVTDPGWPGPGPVLATPIVGGGRLVGVLCVSVRPSRPVSRREMLLLEAFAHRIGDVLVSESAPGAPLQRAMQRFRASWTGSLAH